MGVKDEFANSITNGVETMKPEYEMLSAGRFQSLAVRLWNAHPLRALAEAVVLEIGLLVLLLASTDQTAFVGFSFAWLGMSCVVVCALRARLPSGRPVRVIAQELAYALALGVVLQTVVLVCAGRALNAFAASSEWSLANLLWMALIAVLAYFPLRMAMLLWRMWNITRQRRLLWSIVHAHLMTVLAIVLIFVANEGIRGSQIPAWVASETTATPTLNALLRLLLVVTPAIMYAIVAVPFIAAIMALAGLISYFVARPITRRIEALAALTGQLRSGSYSARIPVEGEDEIAQLQADFNAMAADLERTLSALKTERDTVSGLLEARRELVAGVSHELRTPVATLRGYLESALANWDDAPPPTLRHDVEVMAREVNRLQALIDDLFTLSRAEVGRLTLRCQPTDVSVLVKQVVETGAPLAWASGRVQIAADLPPSLPLALADSGRLEQILRNLIHNSLRHTPPGGIVVIAARAEPETLRLEVRDTGEGISAEDLPHIWERYYRGSKGDDLNAGLGLALVKELTAAMGGSVEVESVPGQGSCFSVRLPLAPANP